MRVLGSNRYTVCCVVLCFVKVSVVKIIFSLLDEVCYSAKI